MTWQSKVQEQPDIVPEGIYTASPFDVSEAEGKFGPITFIHFSLSTNDENDGQEVKGICSSTLSKKSKLGKWISTIRCKAVSVGEELDEDDILHKECRVVIKHSTNDNDTLFANVTDVLPANEGIIDEE